MGTDKKIGNSSEEAMGAQTASAEIDPGDVRGTGQQLQAPVSSFGQEDQRSDENGRTIFVPRLGSGKREP